MTSQNTKSINEIVVEEINRYFSAQLMSEGLFQEKEDEENELSRGQRRTKERIEKAAKRDGKEVGRNVAASVRNFLKDPAVNVSEVMVQATGLSPTSASSLGAKIAKGERPVKQKLAQVVHNIQNEIG